MNNVVTIGSPAARTFAMAMILVSTLGGCGYFRQSRDYVTPRAVPEMRLAQTLNPEAGKNRKVVSGLDGGVAKNVDTAYTKSFEKTDSAKSATQSYIGSGGL